jgi:co-chaperonin GroES (HSP10)
MAKIDYKTVRPVNGWVVIRDENPKVTPAGLHIPDKARNSQERSAVVVSVSAGYHDAGKLIEPPVKRGDRIWLRDSAELVIVAGNEDFCLIHQQHIACVIGEDAKVN